MPELPEVETIRTQLDKFLTGDRISKVEIIHPKYSFPTEKVIGQKIIGIRRIAKILSIDLGSGYSILIHVKMTGQLIYRGKKLANTKIISKKIIGGLGGKHTHVVFYLSDGDMLYFNDVRKFGWMKLMPTGNLDLKVSPEPLKDLTKELFKDILSKSSRNIKVVLMDQDKIGGIGNIYANDALWLAKIDPTKKANNLRSLEVNKLFSSIEKVLDNGLKYGGASENAFVTPDGEEGEYQNHTLVYGREGEICRNCKKNKIEKTFLGGRGTYWCSICQK